AREPQPLQLAVAELGDGTLRELSGAGGLQGSSDRRVVVASSASVRKAPESHQLDAGHREGAFEARAAPGDRTCAGGEREMLDWTAAGVDRAREGSLQAGKGGEQGRLAGAVVADHGEGGAGLEVEI